MWRALAVATALLLVAGVVAAVTDGDAEDGAEGALGSLGAPVREQVEWVLAFIERGDGADELTDRFSAAFLRAVPAEEVVQLAERDLRPMAPFTVERVVTSDATSATLVLRGATGALRMEIAVAADPPHRIEGLQLLPVSSAVGSWEELVDRLRVTAPDVGLLAAEVVEGRCEPIHAVDPDRALPIGSLFKLYVLGAVLGAVEDGSAAWDEPITIRDELRVHSSADLADVPAGEHRTLFDLSRSMIAVSDNTATDHVMDRVGRGAIEAVLEPMGMADPARNQPFPTAAELTRLKLQDEAGRAAWRSASADERRALLAALPPSPVADADVARSGWVAPIDVDSIEWFASASDLCRAQVALAGSGQDEVGRILAFEGGPGAGYDRGRWPSVSFKGGSEPGVLALSFLLVRDDGRSFVLSALLMDTDGAVPPAIGADVIAAFDLLSEA